MVVLTVPKRLRLAGLALSLSVLLIALEVVIEERAPWWHLPYASMMYWGIAFGLICFPLYVWIVSGKRWAYTMTVLFFSIWILSSLVISIRTQNPSLGFFTFFLLIFAGLELFWLNHEMKKTFFDPQVKWFQTLPKPIQGLQCLVSGGEQVLEFKVSRINTEGAFVYSNQKTVTLEPDFFTQGLRTGLELVFKFREGQFQCKGLPISTIEGGKGLGLQFTGMTLDQQKEVSDFVEALRVEGRV